MSRITPFLWFDDKAEEAANFYLSIFKNSKMIKVLRYGNESPGLKGKAMYATFQLDGREFTAFNGGPGFTFSSALSFFVDCETQMDVDYYWEKLSETGEPMQCGWLKDKYGITWQIVPSGLDELLHSQDPEKSKKVFQAMLQMKKLDIGMLKKAFEEA